MYPDVAIFNQINKKNQFYGLDIEIYKLYLDPIDSILDIYLVLLDI